MKFHELAVGTNFSIDNEQYTRIVDERISCCKVYNAIKLSTNEKVQIIPITEVTTEHNNS